MEVEGEGVQNSPKRKTHAVYGEQRATPNQNTVSLDPRFIQHTRAVAGIISLRNSKPETHAIVAVNCEGRLELNRKHDNSGGSPTKNDLQNDGR